MDGLSGCRVGVVMAKKRYDTPEYSWQLCFDWLLVGEIWVHHVLQWPVRPLSACTEAQEDARQVTT